MKEAEGESEEEKSQKEILLLWYMMCLFTDVLEVQKDSRKLMRF